MDNLGYLLVGLGVFSIISALWRPFRAIALWFEARARYWNAMAANEEKKSEDS